MKEYTHFDLEEAIYKAWQTSDDIDLLFKYHGDAERPMTEDEVANALLGIKSLHDMRCWQLMNMLEKVFELNQYCTDPKKLAVRDAIFNGILLNEKPKKKGSKK